MMNNAEAALPTSARLAHFPENFGAGTVGAVNVTAGPGRVPALVLTAEGPRRADLIAWATAHRAQLARLRLLAPAGIGALLTEQAGLATEPLRSGTLGPTATAGLAAAGVFDGVVAFSDPIELRPGDTTTRSLTRLAVFWDIPIAGNRATADLLLAQLTARSSVATAQAAPSDEADAGFTPTAAAPVRGAVHLWTIRATVDDVPGRLAILAASLARRAINILSVQVHLTPDGPVDELLVAASSVLSATDLMSAVVDGGARAPRVTQADAHALVDAPTRALALATRVVRTPEDLPAALTSLLPGADLRWRPEPPAGHAENPAQLWLADPTGGGYLLSRPDAPFTPAESARAHAMIDLATVTLAKPAVGPAEEESWQLLAADGTELTVRRATPDDLDAIVEMHGRCSLTSRLRRYLAGTSCPTPTVLARLVSPTEGHSLVVEDAAGRIVALANLMWTGETAELALLIEDAWQRQRLGTALARRLAAVALGAGLSTVHAVVHASNSPMAHIMGGLGYRLHREYEGGLLTLIASIRPSLGQPRASDQTQRLPNNMWRHQLS